VSVDEPQLTIPSAGGVMKTTVTTNQAQWTASSDQAWAAVSPSIGVTKQVLSVTATPNTTGQTRTATITVTAGTAHTLIRISQDSQALAATVSVDAPQLTIPSAGGVMTTTVTTNKSQWTATSDQGWASVSPSIGVTKQVLSVTATPNTTGQTRTATITVTAGDARALVRVSQDSQAPAATVSVDAPQLTIPAEGGVMTTTVTTNQSQWTATSDQGWASVSPSIGVTKQVLSVTATPNTTSQTRTATITVTAGDASALVRVSQAPEPVIAASVSVDAPQLTIPAAGGVMTTVVTTNQATWNATSDQAWASVSPSIGVTNQVLSVTATPNTTSQTRTATITVTAGDARALVRVSQSPAAAAATVNTTLSLMNISANGGTSTTVVTTNQPSWIATSDQTWASVTPSGQAGDVLSITAQPNTSGAQRIATVTVTAGGAQTVVYAIQDSQVVIPTVTVSGPTQLTLPAEGGQVTTLVTTNQATWIASSNAGWANVTQSGVSGQILTILGSANTSNQSRTLVVTVTAGTATTSLFITQDAAAPSPNPNPNPSPTPDPSPVPVPTPTPVPSPTPAPAPSLTLSQNTWPIGYLNHTTNLTVYSNTTWHIVEIPSWASLTVSGSIPNVGQEITVGVQYNGGFTRTGNIVLQTNGDNGQPIVTATLSITQYSAGTFPWWVFQ